MWPLTLRQAIGIGLDNSQAVHLISFASEGKTFKITPVNQGRGCRIVQVHGNGGGEFDRAAVLEFGPRCIPALEAAERAVASAGEIHKKEQAKLKGGRGTIADDAEAAQRSNNSSRPRDAGFRRDDHRATRFRNLLGLPPADGRRIVPVTLPTEARLGLDWEECGAAMLANQPGRRAIPGDRQGGRARCERRWFGPS